MLSTQQDLEPRASRPLPRHQRPISRLGHFQHALRYSDAKCAHLLDLELANVHTAQNRGVCYFPDRRTASLSWLKHLHNNNRLTILQSLHCQHTTFNLPRLPHPHHRLHLHQTPDCSMGVRNLPIKRTLTAY